MSTSLLQEANSLLASGRPAQAFEMLRAAARAHPSDWELAFAAGQAGIAAGQPLQALDWLETALKAAPGPWTHFYLGLAQSILGLNDYAERNLIRSAQLDPGNWQARYQLGLIKQNRNDLAGAETDYRESMRINPRHADTLNNLSSVLRFQQKREEAKAILGQALAIAPQHEQAIYNLAQLHAEDHDYEQGVALLERAKALAPTNLRVLKLLAQVSYLAGKSEQAAEAYREIARLDPEDKSAEFVGDFLQGVNRPQPPEDFVVQLMDDLAPRFDQHLVGKLQYTAPERIGVLVQGRMGGKPSSLRVLDLGCGTGLVGGFVKPYASTLVGVDLSPKMLEAARAKNVYDDLQLAEMQRYLNECDAESFDLVIAADAFVYVGDLHDVFKGIRRALRSGGSFVFTIEVSPSASEEYFLQNTGRYRHSEDYVAALAQKYGLDIKLSEQIVLRMERDMPVPGAIIWMA